MAHAYGGRVKQIRELLNLTQGELAARLQIKQPTLAQIETGSERASSRLIEMLAEISGFKVGYFEKPDSYDFPLGSLLFRAHASVAQKQKTEAYRHAQVLFELWTTLAKEVNEIPVRLPRFRDDSSLAAKLTRAQLGLSPDEPIPYLINALERSGVIVLAVAIALEKRDAFSLWSAPPEAKPIVVTVAGRPGDRINWSVAHELGHLVLHNPIHGDTRTLEIEADAFAAEFLLPEAAMRAEITSPLTLDMAARLKLRWRVSMQSIIRRAKDLQIITDRAYRYLFEQMARRGWRMEEPAAVAIPPEKPRALREIAELLYGRPVDYEKLATATGIGPRRLRDIMQAHSGGTDAAADKPSPSKVLSITAVKRAGKSSKMNIGGA